MEREQQQLHYWVGNTLVHGKDFRISDFATTPSKMTKMATIAWGPTPRAPDDYSRIMSINTPRFVMFHSPRHPQVNERYFDTQLCFPAEKPQHFPYTDKELEHCKEFIGVIKRLNKSILNYLVENCDDVINWDALYKTMGYKKVSDIPLTKKQDLILDDPKLCNLAFSVGKDSDDGETVIHGTRWYCIKIKIRAESPDDKQLETYYFGKKKDGSEDERKRIQIIINAKPAPSVHINLNTKINGKIEQLAVWPVKKKDDDKADGLNTTSTSVTRCASNDLNALIQRKALLEKHLYDSQQRLGSDITKLLPNGCTGQTILVFDHLTRKLDNKEASAPTMRIFGNVFSIIHTPKAVTTKLLTLDLEAPAELYGEVDDEPSLISDSLAASAVTTTTNVTNLFDQESSVGNDDSTPTQANKFRKTDGGAGKLTTMSVAEMRKNLAAKHKKDDDE